MHQDTRRRAKSKALRLLVLSLTGHFGSAIVAAPQNQFLYELNAGVSTEGT